MIAGQDADGLDALLHTAVARNRQIHEAECINLDPAANVMNPRAEAVLAAGLSSRPSLGWPGAKYETGLEAIEEMEVLAMELATRVFGAGYAEVRVPSGAIGNLYCFMATCRPGDAVVVPPPSVAGHVTHHERGAAGLYGLRIHHAPIDAARYTIDVEGLARLVADVQPALVTVGGSLNLAPHPVREVAEIAHGHGAKVMYDAAHVSGLLAGGVWPNPLTEGADLLSMSTYKSLSGPAGGLVLTNDAGLAERIDAIAHPGLTANYDASIAAALALSLLDWQEYGRAYAEAMVANAQALAAELERQGLPVVATPLGHTVSHQLALRAAEWGGGDAAAQRLRQANLLASAIGLPDGEGLRLGTSEATRWGMDTFVMTELASLIHDALRGDPAAVALRTTALKSRFPTVHFVRRTRFVSANRHEVDHAHQRLAALDDAAGAAAAVAQVRRDRQPAPAADLHALHAAVPALDDLAGAEAEVERVAAVPARIELPAVAPRHPGVVDDHALADGGLVAVADHLVLDQQVGGRLALGNGDDGLLRHAWHATPANSAFT